MRLPWLVSRRRLLIALLVDSGLFAVSYSVIFLHGLGVWPGPELPIVALLALWLIFSYVIGRYYDAAELGSAAGVKQAVRTLITLLISISACLAGIYFTASPSLPATSRGFILPFLLLFAMLSGLLQLGINQILQEHFAVPQLWLVEGGRNFQHQLQQELIWSRQQVLLQPVDLSRDIWPGQDSAWPAGLVVQRFEALAGSHIKKLLHLQSRGVIVLTPVGWSEQVLQRFPPTLVQDEDLLRGQFASPQGSIQKRLKRFGDVLVSGLLLLVTAPLLLLAGLLIRMEDGGPVFYGQRRSGLDGEPFQVWKLRTMRLDAEAGGVQWSRRGDLRITRIGRLLRSTRIDELPQLLAVLSGTMSLIGPRPERPEIEAELEQKIPHYRLRHLIRPGLSGWAQVNYPYGASLADSTNKLSYDLYYLRNFSFWLDLLILVKTIRLVFNARGAVATQSVDAADLA